MRLIDADALRERLQSLAYDDWNQGVSTTWANAYSEIADMIDDQPSVEPERKKGKWIEKHHAYSDEESVIEEWQSCRCSECGRYDTRPYMYYFSEPKFCSWCGAEMDGER